MPILHSILTSHAYCFKCNLVFGFAVLPIGIHRMVLLDSGVEIFHAATSSTFESMNVMFVNRSWHCQQGRFPFITSVGNPFLAGQGTHLGSKTSFLEDFDI